ncbi:MAG: hypothetical protein V2A72_01980 [Candidatus Omnitrophota bacterium]
MPYNSSLDESLFAKTWENDTSRLTVSIYSYNQGAKKLQISRENKDDDGNYKFAKLGRLSKEEITSILPLIQEALDNME